MGCGPKPIKPIEERILDPVEQGCSCVKLTAEELGHMILMGDRKFEKIIEDRQRCIERGHLEDIQ